MTEERVSTEAEVKRAEAQGWRDDQEHPNYKPAWQFVEDGEKIAPILAERQKKIEQELAKNTEVVKQMRTDFFKERRAAEEAGYKKAMAEIKAKQRAAVEDGDTETFDQLERQKEHIQPPKKEEPPEYENTPPDPHFVTWREKHAPWYDKDPVLTGLADGIGREIMTTTPLYGEDFYNEVLRRTKEAMPSKFNGGSELSPTVEGGGRRIKRRGKKDFKSLPTDVQETFNKNKRLQNIFGADDKGKAEYAKEYFNEYPEG